MGNQVDKNRRRRPYQSTPSTKSISGGASGHAEAIANGALALVNGGVFPA